MGGRCGGNLEEDVTARKVTRVAVEGHDRLPPRAMWRAELKGLCGGPASQEADNNGSPLWAAAGRHETPSEVWLVVYHVGTLPEVGLEAGGEGGTPQGAVVVGGASPEAEQEARSGHHRQELEERLQATQKQVLKRWSQGWSQGLERE